MKSSRLLNYFVSGSRSPLSYNSHRAEYYELNNNITSLFILFHALNMPNKFENIININNQFSPNGITLGSSASDVVAILGRAKYSIKKGIGEFHTVLFYRQNITGINVLTQIHFYKNKVVYFKVSFDYLEASSSAKYSIYQSLQEKYDLKIDIEQDNYYIDTNNNYLKVIDNGQINVQFYYNNNEIIEDIKNNLPDSNNKKTNSEDLLKKLI